MLLAFQGQPQIVHRSSESQQQHCRSRPCSLRNVPVAADERWRLSAHRLAAFAASLGAWPTKSRRCAPMPGLPRQFHHFHSQYVYGRCCPRQPFVILVNVQGSLLAYLQTVPVPASLPRRRCACVAGDPVISPHRDDGNFPEGSAQLNVAFDSSSAHAFPSKNGYDLPAMASQDSSDLESMSTNRLIR